MRNWRQTLWIATLWATLALGGNYLLVKDSGQKADVMNQNHDTPSSVSHITHASSAQVADMLNPPRELEQQAQTQTLQYISDHPKVREQVYSMYWFLAHMRWDSGYNWLQIQQFVINVEEINQYLSENWDVEATLEDIAWYKNYKSGILVPSQENDILNRIQIHKLNEAKMQSFPDSTRKNIIKSTWYQTMDPVTAMTAISSVDAVVATMRSNPQFSQILARYNVSFETLWKDDLSNTDIGTWRMINLLLNIEGLKNKLAPENLIAHKSTIDQYNHGNIDLESVFQILAASYNSEDENDD